MPILKAAKTSEPPWREHDRKAQKSGKDHGTVYLVNGDQYTGDWANNKKNGKGTMIWKRRGSIYDGDWLDDKRHGYGMYSISDGAGGYKKQFAGGWKNDKKHGFGTFFYSADEYYEGEWYADKRQGWGRMYYSDGSVYEGEWADDKRHGEGMQRLTNDDRYEGQWKDDLKDGNGKYFFLSKGQLYTGTWSQGTAKTGYLEDLDRKLAPNPPQYPIPKCTLQDPGMVLRQSAAFYKKD